MADEAQKTTTDEAKAAEATKAAAAAAKVAPEKKAAKPSLEATVAAHKIVYGNGKDAKSIPAGALVPADAFTAKERDELIELGALRRATETELAVAEAQARSALEDPIG